MTGRVKIFLCTFLLQKYGRVTEWRLLKLRMCRRQKILNRTLILKFLMISNRTSLYSCHSADLPFNHPTRNIINKYFSSKPKNIYSTK